MRMMAASIALVLALTEVARANFVDGNLLYSWCTTAGTELRCFSYVEGVWDMIDIYQREKAVQTAICVPAGVGVTSRQLRDAAVKYLEQHPADRRAAASSLVWSALKDAWPCRALTPQGYMRY
jgi:hypothetical protein